MKNVSVTITPRPLSGEIKIMPSKSMSHRLAICAALAGDSRVRSLGLSEDIMATCRALRGLGCQMELNSDMLATRSKKSVSNDTAPLDCGESGSTLRFLIPLALDGRRRRFTGRGRLLNRPQEEYARLFAEREIEFIQKEDYIELCGRLRPGLFKIRGDVSSQFISGLLFALPTLGGDSRIEITTRLESRSYIDLTLAALAEFGVMAEWEEDERGCALNIPGNQRFSPAAVSVEGDFSHAAFWLAAGTLGGGAALSGLKKESKQGDAKIAELLRRMGATVEWSGDKLHAAPSKLRGTEIDVSQTPDLFPILAVLAACAEGETRLINAARLRIKESDRLAAMAAELAALGAEVKEGTDSLTVAGGGGLRGGAASAHNDHRIAMSLAVAASACGGELTIDDANCVKKSAPGFWNEYRAMGGSFVMDKEAQ